MNDYILFITEGKLPEKSIINSIENNYLSSNIEIIQYSTTIYKLHEEIKNNIIFDDEDLFIDIGILLNIISKQDNKNKVLTKDVQNSISEIYLFFDYDGHDDKANHQCFIDMLRIFNNETKNGKLFISYPMIEAFKHKFKEQKLYPIFIKTQSDVLAKRSKDKWIKYYIQKSSHEILSKCQFFPVYASEHYKTYVAKDENCHKDLEHISKSTKEIWNNALINNIKATNYLIVGDFSFPKKYESNIIEIFSQKAIYNHQIDKFVNPINHVMVLSPFALFLLEYLGKPLFEEWQKIAN